MSTRTTQLSAGDYVHLHNHTEYSLLDGLTKVPALVERVKELGMNAVAMTDHGTLSGAIEFYKEAKAHNIKPIIGMEAYVSARKHTDKDPSRDKNYHHLITLAMNNKGYQNLMRLSTIANLEGYYYKPRIDHDLLEKYSEGLIIMSGCIGGEVGDHLRQNQYSQAKKTAEWYKGVFGDRYYLEVQDHGHEAHPKQWVEQANVNDRVLEIGKELNIPCVVTCDAHYLKPDDQEAHEILLCVQTGSYLSDKDRMTLDEFDLNVVDPNEVIKRWGKTHPEVILNSRAIAERCNVELELGKILIPSFPLPKGENEKGYLEKLVYQGLNARYLNISLDKAAKLKPSVAKDKLPKSVAERASYELSVIDHMGFNSYFLIIADFVNWGKEQGIVFGPGRGSAAGSIVSYGLRITELDPLAYGLMFERFLNPDRVSMPDIDIDIQDNRRDEVIRYCVEKYGTDHVANIVTFGRMAARNAVRDVARVLQVPYAQADRWAKMIPPPVQGRHIPLATSLDENNDLKNEYKTDESAKRVFDLAIRLEGTIRSHGVHAAGVVIAPDDIVKFVPLELAQKGVVATQYAMGPIEDIGLLKMDFLGLSNLTIIKNALRIIKKVYEDDIDIALIPLDDKKTFELLSRGDTTGVFQLESSGMKRYIKELRPNRFDDIIAMVALYRPGPMQWIEDFVNRKNGRKEIEYPLPVMKAALENTYGIMVYQEQVMQIAKDMCGFTGGQADTLRKAIGKKKRDVMAKLKKEFIEGAINTSKVKPEFVEKFWKDLEKFADYCFPKAHASCYALIAYQTAYLKAHYPDAFMAALMTSDYDNTDRLAIEISECKPMGVEVLPPDVNESFVEFAVVPGKNAIRFGLSAIKNVGTGAVEEILRARAQAGQFNSLEDFFSQVNSRLVNRKTLESLIKSGAFDRFTDRSTLINNIDTLLAFAGRIQKDNLSGQTDLFGGQEESANSLISPKLMLEKSPSNDFTSTEQLAWERELLGIYLSHHPLAEIGDFLAKKATPINAITKDMENRMITIGGSVTDKREIVTKNGQKMAFVKVTDTNSEIETVIFPKLYQEVKDLVERDRLVMIKGKVSSRDKNGSSGEVKILAEKIEEIIPNQDSVSLSTKSHAGLDEPNKQNTNRLYLRLVDAADHDLLMRLKRTIDEHNGDTEVVLVVGPELTKQVIKLPAKINPAESVLDSLRDLVGSEMVKIN